MKEKIITEIPQIKVIERSRIVFGKKYVPVSDNYRDKFYEFLSRRALFTDKE